MERGYSCPRVIKILIVEFGGQDVRAPFYEKISKCKMARFDNGEL
jgi:hypothetical protein